MLTSFVLIFNVLKDDEILDIITVSHRNETYDESIAEFYTNTLHSLYPDADIELQCVPICASSDLIPTISLGFNKKAA